MTDVSGEDVLGRAWVDSRSDGHTVLVGEVAVAAFSHRDEVDAERWAQDYAAALNRAFDKAVDHPGRNVAPNG
jgi:hypothetical protein